MAKVTEQTIRIEKGIPIPAKSNCKLPLGFMEVGDSIFVSEMKSGQTGGFFSYHRPKKFSCRKEGNGIRIWRIK